MSVRLVVVLLVAGGVYGCSVSAAGSGAAVPVASVAAPSPVGAVAVRDLVEGPGSVISGVVRAADGGRPLAGVSVSVSPATVAAPTGYVPPTQTGETDAQGRYSVTGLRPGADYRVSFSAGLAGLTPLEEGAVGAASKYLDQLAPGVTSPYRAGRYRAPAVVNASLRRAARVTGRLTSASGRATEGDVLLVPADAADGERPTSAQVHEGRWAAGVHPGRYRIGLVHPDGTSAGYHPGGRSWARAAVVTVGPRGLTDLRMRLPVPTRLQVTVTDAAGSGGTSGVCVSAGTHAFDPRPAGEPGTAPSPPSAGVSFAGDVCAPTRGVYTIGVEPGAITWAKTVDRGQRLAMARTKPVRAVAGRTTPVRVALPATGILTGRVVDQVTGRPVNTEVEVRSVLAPDLYVIRPVNSRTGAWRAAGLPLGPVKVKVYGGSFDGREHADRYAPAARTAADAHVYQVRSGATTAVPTVGLERLGSVSGRVLDVGGPAVAGARVDVAGDTWSDPPLATAITDAAGRYTLVEVPPGPHRLQVWPPSATGLGSAWVGGAGDAAATRPVTVAAGRHVLAADLRLQPGATLVVVLGAIDASVVVEALDPQGRIVGQVPARLPLRTGKAGRTVTLTGLPATAVRVHAFSTSSDTVRHSWLGGTRTFATATPVALTAGGTVTVSMRAPAAPAR